ncbi:MAG: DUF349 domain-containing protein, partial [Bacteroidota bacterium]
MLPENETPDMSEEAKGQDTPQESSTPVEPISTDETPVAPEAEPVVESTEETASEATPMPEAETPAEEPPQAEESPEQPAAEEESAETPAAQEEETQEAAPSTEAPSEEGTAESPTEVTEPLSEDTPATPSAEPPPAETPSEEETAESPTEDPEPASEDTPASAEETVSESGETEEADAAETPVEEKPHIAAFTPAGDSLGEVSEATLAKVDEITGDREKRNLLLTEASLEELITLMETYAASDQVARSISKVGLVKRSYDALKYRTEVAPELGDRFRQALAHFNRLRSAYDKEMEADRVKNSAKKKELLAALKAIVDLEDPTKSEDVRNIQEQWKSTGQVLREDIDSLNKDYRGQLDKFYQLREMHFELLDYDRKKNLVEKEKLIKEAENLIPPEEAREDPQVWKEKMDMFSKIRERWRAIGHVPREEMDRINNGYREVIDRFFDIRQGFMAGQDQVRQENAVKKEEILTKMAPYKEFSAEKPRAWNEASKELRAFQENWKEIGQAPMKVNSELWSRYRDICNTFFSNKSAFFKKYDEFRAENLAKKRALVEKAEELSQQSDWEKVSKALKDLQKEWKTIGPVPERHSNKLWNRFRTACDTFFEQRRSHYSDMHENEHTNLQAKKALIEEVNKIKVAEKESPRKAIDQIKDIQARWKDIGKVPYKEKDKIWEEFRGAVDAFFDALSLKKEERNELRMKATIDSISDPDERTKNIRARISRLRRKISQSQEKVDQYSTKIQ